MRYPPPVQRYTLPNGDTLTSVRKDIMDAALKRKSPTPEERLLALMLAEVYHGRRCDPAYVFGAATGGDVFVRQAKAVLALLSPAPSGPVDGHGEQDPGASQGSRPAPPAR